MGTNVMGKTTVKALASTTLSNFPTCVLLFKAGNIGQYLRISTWGTQFDHRGYENV
jgi:hypothetical protein